MASLLRTPLMLATCIAALTGCEDLIDPGVATIEEQDHNAFEIDGIIVNGGPSVFYVSKVASIGNVTRRPITDARVVIESTGGFVSEVATHDGNNFSYTIPIDTLNAEEDYRVVVEADGKTFASDFRPIMHTAVMDTLAYDENEANRTKDVWTSYQGAEGDTPYTMWTVDEDYLIMTYNNPYHGYGYGQEKELVMYHDKWGSILLFDGTKLTQNVTDHHIIYRIPSYAYRLKYEYTCTVQQWGLSLEDYLYYSEMKRLTENTGGLFAPMPHTIEGNVHCISHPEVKTHGYVLGSNAPKRKLSIQPNHL